MANIEVTTKNDVLVVDSRLIANELDIQHKNLRQTIEKYLNELQAFGVVTFETDKPLEGTNGGRPERFCYLNEQQATLLMTLSKFLGLKPRPSRTTLNFLIFLPFHALCVKIKM